MNDSIDYRLAIIFKKCFIDIKNKTSLENAKIICEKIAEAYLNNDISYNDFNLVKEKLAVKFPIILLDIFVEKYTMSDYFWMGGRTKNVVSLINDDLIIDWCNNDPENRYPKIASAVVPFQKSEKGDYLEWSPLAQNMINNAKDPIQVLNTFRLLPVSWSGSLAEIMQTRLSLLKELKNHANLNVVDWASKKENLLEESIRYQREWELKIERERNERFE